jgi:hypothetical protein
MEDNPYRPPLKMARAESRGVVWWLLALIAGAVIGIVFASMALAATRPISRCDGATDCAPGDVPYAIGGRFALIEAVDT